MTEERAVYMTKQDEELAGMSDPERAFLTYWHVLMATLDLPEPENEYQFHALRKWRFDFAFPDQQVAVELDGGTWSEGRHVRGLGFQLDCEKINAAQMEGWVVLRFTTDMLTNDPQQVVRQVGDAVVRGGSCDRHPRR